MPLLRGAVATRFGQKVITDAALEDDFSRGGRGCKENPGKDVQASRLFTRRADLPSSHSTGNFPTEQSVVIRGGSYLVGPPGTLLTGPTCSASTSTSSQ